MVQGNTESSPGEETHLTEQDLPPIPIVQAKGIPNGKYRLVGWGIDTTGNRLIDEICQIAAYTPTSTFSQYIMPYTDFNPTFSKRHNIRIVNSVKYRRLKNMKTNQFLKTKSEVSALTDFLQWLEEARGDTFDGVILIYHEVFKVSPGMLLEALKRYELTERFGNVVKGFANGFNIAQAKCANTTKTFTLRVMNKVLLNSDKEDFASAVDRAEASYHITVHLAQGERNELDAKAVGDCKFDEPHIIEFVCPFSNPISAEQDEVAMFKEVLNRQNTFRPVFGALLRANPTERKHATYLRRLLAENDLDYDAMKTAYETGAKEGLETLIKSKISNANEKDLTELLDILDHFFDPDKKAIRPKQYSHNGRRNRSKSFNDNRKKHNSESKNDSVVKQEKTTDDEEASPASNDESSPAKENKQVDVEVQ